MKREFLRQHEVAAMLGISLSTVWRWKNKNLLPKPICLSDQVVGWRASTIETWLEKKEMEVQQS